MAWFTRFWRREKMERDLDDELRFHIEMRTRDNLAAGMPAEEARDDARRRFGNRTLIQEQARSASGAAWIESLGRDLKQAARMLRKNPGFTCVAVLALALGIGANSAMFSVVDAILLKPLPYANPDQLVWLTRHVPAFNTDVAGSLDYFEWREQSQIFKDVTGYSYGDANLVGGEEPQRVQTAAVSASFFRTLGVNPALGRVFPNDEDLFGGPKVAILTQGLFVRRFGANPAIIGGKIVLDDQPYTIVGVMPASFRFPQDLDVDLLTPLALRPETNRGAVSLVNVIARMRPGILPDRVRGDLDVVHKRYADRAITMAGAELTVVPLHRQLVGDKRSALLVLLGAVGLVLLIACGNVANLLMARAADRRREVAVRSALGAGRGRLIRQLLTESVLLAIAGAALGLVIAGTAIRVFITLGRSRIPFIDQTSINPVVLAFTAVVAILTGILFGLAPALTVSKADVIGALKQSVQNATASTGQRRFRGMLISGEIALALVLLIGAGLLIKSLWILESLDPGFKPDHVLSVDIKPIP